MAATIALVAGIAAAVSRQASTGRRAFFLAGGQMPVWAVAISVVATSLSAATFVGGPQEAYAGDLTYLITNLGGIAGGLIVALVFLPRFYRYGVTTVYELVGAECGPIARRMASAMFLIGRVAASGARLYMAAIPCALFVFGSLEPQALCITIVALALLAIAYTAAGGLKAVIWTDVVQAAIVFGTAGIAVIMLVRVMPADLGTVFDGLREAGKLQVVDLSTDPTRPYTLLTGIIGFTLLMTAAYGTDQDLTQRMLACRDARAATKSLLLAVVLGWPMVAVFMFIGLLLAAAHGQAGFEPVLEADPDSRRVFLDYMLEHLPLGVRGLMLAGVLGAALSSTDSALGAMASATIVDFTHARDDNSRASRIAVAAWGLVLAAFACFCVWWQQASGERLLGFALSAMTFAYAGLLGVFGTILFTRTRGSGPSVVAALAAGFFAVLALDKSVYPHWSGSDTVLAFPWRLTIATAISAVVCLSGKRRAGTPASRADS